MNVRIGERSIGTGERCYVIAEAGSNHDGRLEQALSLIDVAIDAGADAVKFQVFRAARLYPRTAGVSGYLQTARPIYDIIADMEMPQEWLPILHERATASGVEFLVSVFDEASADLVSPFVRAFKVASYEMTHLPLVRHLAAKGKPLIVSTGTASIDEVATTVQWVRKTSAAPLALMQCTAAYPAPLDSLNLRSIATLAAAFGVPVGLSDHSRDPIVAPIAAVAIGASLIEKHFTVDSSLPGPDHRFALEPDELREMVRRIRQTESALGTGDKVVAPVEQELRAFARRTIFATRAIDPGEVLSPANVAVLRCGQHTAGFAPADYEAVLGRTVRHRVADMTVLQEADLE